MLTGIIPNHLKSDLSLHCQRRATKKWSKDKWHWLQKTCPWHQHLMMHTVVGHWELFERANSAYCCQWPQLLMGRRNFHQFPSSLLYYARKFWHACDLLVKTFSYKKFMTASKNADRMTAKKFYFWQWKIMELAIHYYYMTYI